MLIEALVLHGFKVISANTDGITTIVPKTRKKEYLEVCKNWENKTRFELEYTKYSKYVRRDVNNYLAICDDGYIKTKGVFINKIELNKGYDKPIVSIALYEYFVNNKPIKETILNHRDIHDFCIAKKIDDKFTNEFHYVKNGKAHRDILQKSVRYYVSTDGGTLLKKNENTIIEYEANKRVTIFNEVIYRPMNAYNIDYGYYINSTQKIINEIINPQLSLF